MKSDIKTLADSVFTAVTGYVDKALGPVRASLENIWDQLGDFQKKLNDIPAPKDGEPGKDGTSVTLEDVEPLIVEVVGKAVALIPPAEPGRDGKDVDTDALWEQIADRLKSEVAALPPAKDGKDGESVDPASVEDFLDKAVDARVQAAVAQIPPARDGLDGKDGEPGRHALQIDILPSINPELSYARGTFASYRGGLIHALRATEAVTGSLEKAGWEIIVEGYPQFEVQQDDEDPRVFYMRSIKTSGQPEVREFRIPAVIDAGFYQPEKQYRTGDGTTFGGSFWIAQKDTDTKPCIGNDDWRLSVRKGRDAKRAS